MIRFIGKRILQMIPVVLLVATLIFGILYLVPGDPAKMILGLTATPEQIAALKEAIAQKEAADAAQEDEKEAEEAPDEA